MTIYIYIYAHTHDIDKYKYTDVTCTCGFSALRHSAHVYSYMHTVPLQLSGSLSLWVSLQC